MALVLTWITASVNAYLLFSRDRTVQLLGQLIASAYSIALAFILLFSTEPASYRARLYHVCSISILLLADKYVNGVGLSLWEPQTSISSQWSTIVLFAALVLLVLIIGTMPTGPQLYQDQRGMYSKAVDVRLEESPPRRTVNVIGTFYSSIFSRMLFMSPTTYIRSIAAQEQIDVHDLPAIPSWIRSQNVLPRLLTTKTSSTLSFGTSRSFFRRIWGPEGKTLSLGALVHLPFTDIKAVVISICMVPLWYLPHYCLQQILRIIDENVNNHAAFGFAVIYILSRVTGLYLNIHRNAL